MNALDLLISREYVLKTVKKLKEAVSYPESSRREIEIEAAERLEDFVNLYDYLLSKSNVNGLEDFDRRCIQKIKSVSKM